MHGEALALALDATARGERLVVLSVSALYRGSAIPVAWHVTAQRRGPWLVPPLEVLARLGTAVPARMMVVVLADRGLWSPKVWTRVRALGWHPVLRLRPDVTFRPLGGTRIPAKGLVPGPDTPGSGPALLSNTARCAVPARCWSSGTPITPNRGSA